MQMGTFDCAVCGKIMRFDSIKLFTYEKGNNGAKMGARKQQLKMGGFQPKRVNI